MRSRHELVWLRPEAWQRLASGAPRDAALLARWQRHDWPLIARRQTPEASADQVCLGLPAPPLGDSRPRLALCVARQDVARHRPPLAIGEVLAHAPAAWGPGLAALQAALPDLRVFGSLAMQAITGQTYLRPQSDIDLLFTPSSRAQLDAGLELLAASGLPLDGEILFPSGAAVAWKEWRQASERVLLKSASQVGLAARQSLLAELEAA